MDKGNQANKCIMGVLNYKAKVYIMGPSKGALNGCCILREEMRGVSDASVVRFPGLRQEGQVWEDSNYRIDQYGGRNLLIAPSVEVVCPNLKPHNL